PPPPSPASSPPPPRPGSPRSMPARASLPQEVVEKVGSRLRIDRLARAAQHVARRLVGIGDVAAEHLPQGFVEVDRRGDAFALFALLLLRRRGRVRGPAGAGSRPGGLLGGLQALAVLLLAGGGVAHRRLAGAFLESRARVGR